MLIALGQRMLARTLCGPYSSATAFVIPTTACFDAQYAAKVGAACQARWEPVLTIVPPPRATRCGSVYFMQSQTLRALTRITSS